jgi:hypothetical protein
LKVDFYNLGIKNFQKQFFMRLKSREWLISKMYFYKETVANHPFLVDYFSS